MVTNSIGQNQKHQPSQLAEGYHRICQMESTQNTKIFNKVSIIISTQDIPD